MIKKNNKKVIAIYRGGNPISKVFKGGLMVFPDSVQPDQPYVPKYNFAGKFSDSSTEDSWYFVNGAVREALPVNASTKIFDINSNKFTAAVNFGPAIVNSTTIPSTLEELYAFPGYEDNVISIASMFYDCTALKIVDLSNLERKGITNINYLFSGCTNLETLYIDKFNPNGLTNYSEVFKYCNKLMLIRCTTAFRDWCWENAETINLPEQMKNNGAGVWDLVDILKGSFAPSISTLALTDDTNNTPTYQLRFNDINTDIDVDDNLQFSYSWDKETKGDLTNLAYMCPLSAYSSSDIMTIDSWFDTHDVTYMAGMFWGCDKLVSLDLSNFDTSNVTDISYMFNGCTALETLDLSNFDTSKIQTLQNTFGSCKNLTDVNLNGWDTGNVETMRYMFSGCKSLKTLDLSHFNTSKVEYMSSMFSFCTALETLDLSNFDTSNVKSMNSMFSNCENLTSLDLSSFNTEKVTEMYNMFYLCINLTSLDLSNFDVSNVTTMFSMFYACDKLNHIKCKQAFKDWCITNQDTIGLPTAMREGGTGTWEIID